MVRIGIPGEFDPRFAPHRATNDALAHAATLLGIELDIDWIPTGDLATGASGRLRDPDGIWCPPGSPYRNLEGALAAIRLAREESIPFIGTCGGYQHAILEYARNVMGFADARHAEYGPSASRLFISALACSLAGQTMRVFLQPGTRAHALYAVGAADEAYYCNFGLNPDERPALEASGLIVSGLDQDGEARIVELPGHPFYLATLFVPQTSSTSERPHPLVTGFVAAARNHALNRQASHAGRSAVAISCNG